MTRDTSNSKATILSSSELQRQKDYLINVLGESEDEAERLIQRYLARVSADKRKDDPQENLSEELLKKSTERETSQNQSATPQSEEDFGEVFADSINKAVLDNEPTN